MDEVGPSLLPIPGLQAGYPGPIVLAGCKSLPASLHPGLLPGPCCQHAEAQEDEQGQPGAAAPTAPAPGPGFIPQMHHPPHGFFPIDLRAAVGATVLSGRDGAPALTAQVTRRHDGVRDIGPGCAAPRLHSCGRRGGHGPGGDRGCRGPGGFPKSRGGCRPVARSG